MYLSSCGIENIEEVVDLFEERDLELYDYCRGCDFSKTDVLEYYLKEGKEVPTIDIYDADIIEWDRLMEIIIEQNLEAGESDIKIPKGLQYDGKNVWNKTWEDYLREALVKKVKENLENCMEENPKNHDQDQKTPVIDEEVK